MNNPFWIGVEPAMSTKMLDFSIGRIGLYRGVRFG